MTDPHTDPYRDPQIARRLVDRIRAASRRPIRLMEVCGTHTVSIFRSGIRSLLPETVTLLSGPGCPVCVTDQADIDALIEMAGMAGVTVATFGDLMRVPGSRSSLAGKRAEGADVRMVYSAFDALQIARKAPDRRVVFPGIGFETTAPTVAATLQAAKQEGVDNFLVMSVHKRVPPALSALVVWPEVRVDGFILPGHVSVIIGTEGYREVLDGCRIPGVVAGFEPADILRAILILVDAVESNTPILENAYGRAVAPEGNPKARAVMGEVFETTDARWRGLGVIPGSGMGLRPEYRPWDAMTNLAPDVPPVAPPKGCACGEILTGTKIPFDCPLFGRACTPLAPVGPCMVSTEGTCAAYYRYGERRASGSPD